MFCSSRSALVRSVRRQSASRRVLSVALLAPSVLVGKEVKERWLLNSANGIALRPGSLMLRAALGLLIVVAGCSASADVSRDELAAVVERDAVVFPDSGIPIEVLDRLAVNRVVVLGETHHLREHWAFVGTLLEELHDRGFRQLLIENPQMVDWLLDDWVVGGDLVPGWEPPDHLLRKLSAIHDFNETLPADERIHVRSIDANEAYYGGAESFRNLLMAAAENVPSAGPIADFTAIDYVRGTSADQAEAIGTLLAALQANSSNLTSEWGPDWYATILEMVEVEVESVAIRAERSEDDNQAARMREDVIKGLADARLAEIDGGTVVNFGAHHAQKAHLMGTEQEWMGDYLAHTSTVVDGSIIVIGFTSALTELEPGAGGTPWDILESSSPDNEILRVIAEAWPTRTVFLALTDPLFTARTVAYNSEDEIYVTSLGEQFDALIQYGLAHRWPQS